MMPNPAPEPTSRPAVILVISLQNANTAQLLSALHGSLRDLATILTPEHSINAEQRSTADLDGHASQPPVSQQPAKPAPVEATPPLTFEQELLLEGLAHLMKQAVSMRDRALLWRSKTEWFERSGVTRQRRDTNALIEPLIGLGFVEATARGNRRTCFTLTSRGAEYAEFLRTQRRSAP